MSIQPWPIFFKNRILVLNVATKKFWPRKKPQLCTRSGKAPGMYFLQNPSTHDTYAFSPDIVVIVQGKHYVRLLTWAEIAVLFEALKTHISMTCRYEVICEKYWTPSWLLNLLLFLNFIWILVHFMVFSLSYVSHLVQLLHFKFCTFRYNWCDKAAILGF